MDFTQLYTLWESGEIKKGDFIIAINYSSSTPFCAGKLENIKKTDDSNAVYQNIVSLYDTINFLDSSDMEYSRNHSSEVIPHLRSIGKYELVPLDKQELGNPKIKHNFDYFTCNNVSKLKELMGKKGIDDEQIRAYFQEIKKFKKSGD